jgi:DNA-binding response OmpR family regulator
MEKGTILLADNLTRALETRAEFLQKAGYRVIKAGTYDEVLQHLSDSWVHLAVLDMRLVDDNDTEDESGLELAENEKFRAIPKIILTGFPTYASVREALTPFPDGTPKAVAFLAKEEGLDALLEAIEATFRTHVRRDRDLKIVWNPPPTLSFHHLAAVFEPALDPPHLPARLAELEDLFRKLLYGVQQITLLGPVWQRPGRVALEILAYYPADEARFLVTCGEAGTILAEYARTPQTTVQGQQNIHPLLKAETRHYAALAWQFPAAEIETQSFERFFFENGDRKVSAAIEQLYQSTLAPWHSQTPAPQAEKSLSQATRESLKTDAQTLTQVELERLIPLLSRAAIACRLPQVTSSADQISYHFPNGRVLSFPNPAPTLEQGLLPDPPARCGMSLNSLEVDTLLVSRAGQVWLTDFSRLGVAPVWNDFLALETAIRFNLIPSSDLLALYDMEQQLLALDGLSGSIPLSNVELECKPAVNAILTIRHQAAELLGEDSLPYQTGLFFHTLQGFQPNQFHIRQPAKHILSLLYRLMLAGLLAAQITRQAAQGNASSTQPAGIAIDEKNHVVTVDGREVHLTPTEFDLLLHLYRNADQLCRREEIARAVFGAASTSLETVKGLLNTHMDRLRFKIEKDPKSPRYLLTVRGEGYKLVQAPK